MPVPDTRIVILGVPRAEKGFEVVEVSKREAARAVELLAREAVRLERQLRAQRTAADRQRRREG